MRSSPAGMSIATRKAAHGSSAAPTRPDSASAASVSACGAAKRTARADEVATIGASAAIGALDIEEGGAAGEVGVVGVPREQRAGAVVDRGDDLHHRLGPLVAEHPLDVTGHGQLPRLVGRVAQRERRELHRRVDRDMDAQRGRDPVLGVLEAAVAESVPDLVRQGAARRLQRRRPEPAGRLVANVERLGAGIGHRVVGPRRQTQFVGVLAPGGGAAALGHQRAELGVRDHVRPGRRRHVVGRHRHHVLAMILGEAAVAVEREQRGRVERHGCRCRHDRSHKIRERRLCRHADRSALDLLAQAAGSADDHDARHAVQQGAVAVVERCGIAHEDATCLADAVRRGAVGQRMLHLLEQSRLGDLSRAGDDHQFGDDAVRLPECLCADQLAYEIELVASGKKEQHHRHIAGDAEAPEARLATRVLRDLGGVGPHCRRRVEDRAGETLIESAVGRPTRRCARSVAVR